MTQLNHTATTPRPRLTPVGFALDEAESLLSFIGALNAMISVKFDDGLQANEMQSILNAIELQAQRVHAAIDERGGLA